MNTQRYHGLDALRAAAMLLGLVLHAAQVYLREDFLTLFAPWATVPAPPATDVTGMVSIWIHLWRMPVFFLLAGFFAQMVITRRGGWAFWQDRFVRIFLVLVITDVVITFWRGTPVGTLGHLWFLWVLVPLCALAPLTAKLAPSWLFDRPVRLALCVAPLALLGLWNRNNIWQDVPNSIWDPQISAFALYGAYFWLGQMMWSGRGAIEHFKRPIVIATLLALGFAAHGALGAYYYAPIPELLRQIGVAIASLGLVFGLVGLAEALIQRPRRAVTLGIEMAYFVYLVHLYIVYELSIWSVQMGWHQHLAIPIVTVAGFTLSAALYFICARYTPLNWLLAGYKNSWFKWPFARNGLRGAQGR